MDVLLEQSDSESAGACTHAVRGPARDRARTRRSSPTPPSPRPSRSRRRCGTCARAIPLAQVEEGPNVKHDIALPISRIPDFVAATDAALARAFPGIRLVDFGHLGDGNLHYNVRRPIGVAPDAFLRDHEDAVNAIVYDAVVRHGGSISAEHGIGALKRDELARRKQPLALALMRAIKTALDPQGRMNPGRVL